MQPPTCHSPPEGRDRERGGVELRDTVPEDAAELAGLIDAVARERRFLANTSGFSAEDTGRFIRLVRATGGVHILAARAGAIIGWCDVLPHPFEGLRHSGRLGMGVHKDHRSTGVGRRLLTAALQRAEAAGVLRIELEVFGSNQPAIRLYESFGFGLEGRKVGARRLDGVTEDILLFARHTPFRTRSRGAAEKEMKCELSHRAEQTSTTEA